MFLTLKSKLLSTGAFVDCEYLDKYINLIIHNLETEPDKNKTQHHHIIPRAYFKCNKLKVDNSSDNMVHLLYKDHILAHYYLALCSINNFKYSMENAFMMLANFNAMDDAELIQNLDHYQNIYESVAQRRRGVAPPNKGMPMSDEQKQKISKTLMGHSVSNESRQRMREAQLNMSPEARARITLATQARNYVPTIETRLKQSKSLMGHKVSAETRAKISNGNRKYHNSRQWITNGIENRLIAKEDSIPNGFKHGRTIHKNESNDLK